MRKVSELAGDAIARDSFGIGMGPFALMNLWVQR